VQQLWEDFGLITNLENSQPGYYLETNTEQYESFVNGVNLLGNTIVEYDPTLEYGAYGLTADEDQILSTGWVFTIGVYLYPVNDILKICPTRELNPPDGIKNYAGSYLVKASPVQIPATAWLFGSALVGLVGVKNKRTSYAG
jgi:hypothetical protein